MKKVLIAALCSLLIVRASSASVAVGSVAGRVLPVPERPLPTAVWVVPSGDGPQLRTPVAPDGTFAVEGVPAGTAEVAVETAEGLYVVSTPVAIAPGITRHLQLALGGRQDTSPPPGPPEKKRRAGGVWANPVYATLIVVGAAVVVGLGISALTEPDNEPASPSNP